MREAAANAPLFIEAFYDGCKTLKDENEDLAVPDIGKPPACLQSMESLRIFGRLYC